MRKNGPANLGPPDRLPAQQPPADDSRPGGAARGELVIGRTIAFHGAIAECRRLVVEGSVDASLRDCGVIEVAPAGRFIGCAESENADIAGAYEGDLVVRDRLLIRATGKVTGKIRYGKLEIECGGEITGDVQVASAEAAHRPRAAGH